MQIDFNNIGPMTIPGMNNGTGTVTAQMYNDDSYRIKYANPGLGLCDFNHEGMTFISSGWQKPDGLCDNAWKSMMEYVFTLAHGGGNFYDGELRNPKAFIASCNDGFRPVSYLIEAMDEDVDQMFA